MHRIASKRWLVAMEFVFALTVCAARGDTFVFSNTNNITINWDNNPPTKASPYPSTIDISGLTGQVITNLTVTLSGFTHPFPSDVAVILAGPQGQTALLMSDNGGDVSADPVTNLVLTFDDNSIYLLPIGDALYSGTWHLNPGQTPLFFDFPPPAPAGNSNAVPELSVFDGTDPDGTWSLFLVDEFPEVTNGYISDGWSMSVSTGIPLSMKASSTNLVLSWPAAAGHTYAVQYVPNTTNFVAWSNLPVVPVLVSNRFVSTNRNVGSGGYFRLLVQ